jgi:hypothetical protein
MRDWWLERLSLYEIREIGACLDSLAGSDRDHAAWEH